MFSTTATTRKLILLGILFIALVVGFGLYNPRFLLPNMATTILQFSTLLALVSLGQALVVLSGGAGIDLSVGGAVSLSAVATMLAVRAGLPQLLIPPMALAAGLLLGLFNGVVVVRFRILPLIATLGTYFVYAGTAMALTNGSSLPGVPPWLTPFGRGALGIVPLHFLCFVLPLFLATAGILTFTSWGRWIYALGFNERSARLVGIPVDRIRLLAYTLSGGFAGMAALVSLAWFGSARPNIGVNLELESLAAALLGGIAITGGVGGVLGVLLAVVMIVTLKTGLQFINVPTIWQVGIVGLLLILSLLLDLLPQPLESTMTNLEARIAAAVEAASDRIAGTLKDLIGFASIVMADPTKAGPGERLCQQYLKGRLEEIGFSTDLWDPDGPALYEKYRGRPAAHEGRTFEGRPNLGGTLKGTGGGRSIFLTGHIDVVPPGPPEHWRTDPFVAQTIDGFVQGRGAVDMKGGVACMLMAIEILQQLEFPLRGDVVWGTVVDEEIGGMGALAMADRGYRADVGIMTEPTGNTIAPICHGILWARIIIDGVGGHAELKPNSWDSTGPVDAIWLCRQMLDGLDILNRRWQFDPRKNHPLMDLPCQIIPTQIKAGEHPASMAGRAEIVIDVQYLPSEKDEFLLGGHVKREVEAHIAGICAADPFLRAHPARVEWILDADCAEVPSDHPFVAAMQEAVAAAGLSPKLTGAGAHTDMGIPTELGHTPTLNFGPGDPTQAHQPNERVSIEDLLACTRGIALTIARWCA